MKIYNRIQKIKEILDEDNYSSIEDLVKKLDVSKNTIYRDFIELEKDGYINRIKGGAKVNRERLSDADFYKRLSTNISKKKEIAKKAIEFLSNGDSIFIDSSTTCYLFASEIYNSNLSNITIVTNSPFAICKLSSLPHIHIISTGGELQYRLNGLAGSITNNFIKNVNFDKAFISGRGFSIKNGLTTSESFIVEVLQNVIKVAREVNLLVDSSKFFKSGISHICSIDKITRIITDKSIDCNVIKEIIENNVECII